MSTLTEVEREHLHDVRVKRDALWAWLGAQSQEVSTVIALRVGFRALPFVVQKPAEGRFSPKEGQTIVSAFRYIALGRLQARRRNLALNMFATLLNSVSDKNGSSATAAVREASRSAPSGSPLESSADAASNAASRAAMAAMFSATSPAGAPWDAIAADRAWIATSDDPLVLLDAPMWPNRASAGGVPEPYASQWEAMRAALDDEDTSWRVWTAWYQDRLWGAPAAADHVEYLRITMMPDAMARAEDPSPDGLQRWTADIQGNQGLVKGSPKKANRVAAMLVDELEDARS
ncbi:hypothetical protein D3273_03025 [Lichenibacterium minor]|uniref:Uncharacterized protein n=1 Tax=Lichenibacterium minor TaxID=2316528 RepID=A0A4Q2UDS1_9HYPH|nr:hypothetical protein [Lichenibacterium minor]RYC33461.1 hypothetical protein D3273_03025 [Lichenibacterium minor]